MGVDIDGAVDPIIGIGQLNALVGLGVGST
jgi:hypothetical protein